MHINARLPVEVEIGAVRIDPDFEDTEIAATDGNREVRNIRTAGSLLRFEISYPHSQQDANYLAVKAAYKAARGGAHSFDFQDHSEFTATDAAFGVGDGVETVFPLYIPYTFGSETHARRIYRPVSPISLKVDGVSFPGGYSVNYTTGIVTFSVAPADTEVLSWSGDFNIPVRFDSTFNTSLPATHLVHIDTMVLKEVLL
jgi:uncharacterized protein (TIGR02217 family)